MKTWIVVVEQGKRSSSVGPYHNRTKAQTDADTWDGADGARSWVEPVVRPEDFTAPGAPRARRDTQNPQLNLGATP